MADQDFGLDLWCTDDLLAELRPVSGVMLLAQALIRRWTTPRGMLLDDPGYGTDVRENMNETVDESTIDRMRSELRSEALNDERVAECTVTAAVYTQSTGKVRFTVEITVHDGSLFSLVLDVSAVSVDLITVE